MFPTAVAAMSNSTLSDEASLSSFNPLILQNSTTNNIITSSHHHQQQEQQPPKKVKKKRSLPGNPDPDAEVIALSPKSLLATNRFICEICNKGFQRDQNLQLHRRGHNLPWKLKQRSSKDVIRKKAYVCPEPTCVHHHPSRALGDLTGIKKHFCRKHGEKKYKCEKCSKIYAVQSDWKAHSKTCGTREYRCDCGTLFSRKDSFITHRAFCDALAEESARLSTNPFSNPILPPPPPPQQPPFSNQNHPSSLFAFSSPSSISLSTPPPPPWDQTPQNPNPNPLMHINIKTESHFSPPPSSLFQPSSYHPNKCLMTPPSSSPFASDTNATSAHFLSATALLQKAATIGAVATTTLQQNQNQAIMVGFDALGTSEFRHNAGPTTSSEVVMAPTSQAQMLPPLSQSSSLSTTSTTPTPDHHSHSHSNDHYNTMLGLASLATWRKNNEGFTRDFLGLTAGDHYGTSTNTTANANESDENEVEDMLKFTGGLQYGVTAAYDRDNSSLLLKPHQQQPQLVAHHHHHQLVDHQPFAFVAAESPATAASETRWG